MKILSSDLDSAVQKGIIDANQAAQLWVHLESLRSDQPQFQSLHVLYYLGGILVLASMSWLLTTAWDKGFAILVIAGLFGSMYVHVGNNLWKKAELRIPGGLLITAAVGLAPVFIYGFQRATGLWPDGDPGDYQNYHAWIKGSWFFMEAGTIVAAVIALRFYRFAFIAFPLALTLFELTVGRRRTR